VDQSAVIPVEVAAWRRPTRLTAWLFAAKMAAFQLRRTAIDLAAPMPLLARTAADFPVIVGEARGALLSAAYGGEAIHQHGKINNLRCAAAALHGRLLAAGAVFSFWRHIGRTTRAKGYAEGRMLQSGWLSPAVGGGLCQLSTALYEVALQAHCRIVERHAHSRIVPGPNAAKAGRDATVAWNYVDLRFASDRPLKLEVRVTQDELIVRLRAMS
jgi:vancomycin resistance protein YoaR